MTRRDNRIKPSEITPEDVYLNRRNLVAGAVAMGLLPACQPHFRRRARAFRRRASAAFRFFASLGFS